MPVPEILPYPEPTAGRLRSAATLAASTLAALVVIAASSVSRRAARLVARAIAPRAARLVSPSTVLVIAGGGYMYSAKKRINPGLIQCLVSIRLGSALALETVMMPQSIGPLHKQIDANLVRWSLTGVEPVARELVSLEASSTPPKLPGLRVVPDAAFWTLKTREPRLQTAPPRVRIVVMDWSWSSSADDNKLADYIRKIAALTDRLSDLGWIVSLGGHSSIPEHGQDDIAIARAVATQAATEIRVDASADYDHLVDEYRDADLVIGTRLHSCIMALALGTPAIALGYQEKSRGVLGESGLEAWFQKVDEIDVDALVGLAQKAIGSDVAEQIQKTQSRISAYYGTWTQENLV